MTWSGTDVVMLAAAFKKAKRDRAKKNADKLQEALTGMNTSKVLYGQTVQLQHVQSGKFLIAKTDIVARCDKKSMQITLDEGSDGCWFDIQPRFRTRREPLIVAFHGISRGVH